MGTNINQNMQQKAAIISGTALLFITIAAFFHLVMSVLILPKDNQLNFKN